MRQVPCDKMCANIVLREKSLASIGCEVFREFMFHGIQSFSYIFVMVVAQGLGLW